MLRQVTENWLPARDLDGYRISDRGRVTGKRGLLSPYLRNGYYVFTVYGPRRDVYVHVVMLETFVCPRPKGMWALHRDDIGTHNDLENLYWGTPLSNARDMVAHGTHNQARKTHCSKCGGDFELNKRGYRICRFCQSDYNHAYYEARKAAAVCQ